MSDRYAERPFLRLLELYVLWAIDQLPEQHRKVAEQMAPALGQAMGTGGDWQQIVAQQMGLPVETPWTIRGEWQEARRRAEASFRHLTPQQFAEEFVDAHFVEAGGSDAAR